MKQPVKAGLGRRISTIVILIGAVIFLAAAIYWAVGYPWQLFFARIGWVTLPDDLPEPSPLPADLLVDMDPDSARSELGELPEAVGWLTARPPVYMTQLGVIKLPKIGVAENIVEGTGNELLYAVGHVRGSALPGEAGNCVLAGHRNYVQMNPFRHLDKMEPGDAVLVRDDGFQYSYEVFEVFEVGPHDVWVMEEQEDEEQLLTLITCTPVLNPVNRLIVWCRLVEAEALEETAVAAP